MNDNTYILMRNDETYIDTILPLDIYNLPPEGKFKTIDEYFVREKNGKLLRIILEAEIVD